MEKKNKYFDLLEKVMAEGSEQENKKGRIKYLINERLDLRPEDLLDIFEDRPPARQKLKRELGLFMAGERRVEEYRKADIEWWDYIGPEFKNSYPDYFMGLGAVIEKVNASGGRPSKNYMLFLGENGADTNQLPCISCIQFQLDKGRLRLTAYQRSSDASLGLPSDIYQMYLIARKFNWPLASITFFFGNVHIYENNWGPTRRLLSGEEHVRFELNV